MSANFLLWTYSVASTSTDLSTAGPIDAPCTVTVRNLGQGDDTVYLSVSDYSSVVETTIPGDSIPVFPGETSPVITIPSGYSLYAETASATVNVAITQSA